MTDSMHKGRQCWKRSLLELFLRVIHTSRPTIQDRLLNGQYEYKLKYNLLLLQIMTANSCALLIQKKKNQYNINTKSDETLLQEKNSIL